MKISLWCFALAMLASPALGADKAIIQNGAPIIPDATIAHVLFRYKASSPKWATSIIIVRVLSDEEKTSLIASRKKDGRLVGNPNVFANQYKKAYTVTEEENIYVLAVPPGRYIIGGLGFYNIDREDNNGLIFSCFCMGTVSFNVAGGKITDIGTLVSAFDFKPTDLPELTKMVRGHSIGVAPVPAVGALRPASKSRPLPAQFASLPVVSAEFRAFGKFPNVLGGSIERLAPIDGVLDYDEDRIIDLKATAK